jgi:hypothetical protein
MIHLTRRVLPLLLALHKALPAVTAMAAHSTQVVREQAPAYAAEVGDVGMAFCAEDNAFILHRVMYTLLGAYLEPQEALMWWWENSVGSYLVHRGHAGMGANLRGLRSALEQQLGNDAAVQALFRPIHKIYNEIVGSDVLLVVYTQRGEARRIISARIANRKERELWQTRA